MPSDAPQKFWSVGEDIQPSPLPQASLWNSELWATVEEEIDALDTGLRELSLDIHGRLVLSRNSDEIELPTAHPELLFEEEYVTYRFDQFREFLIIHLPTQDMRTMS